MAILLILLGLAALVGFGYLSLGLKITEEKNQYNKTVLAKTFAFNWKYAAAGISSFILATTLAALLNNPLVKVDAGSIGIVKSFGRVVGMLQPGLHVIRPYGEDVTEIAVQRRVVKVSEGASSSDLQIVNIEVTLGYHIDPNFADYALVQLNNDAEARVILPANLEAIKAQTALYDVQNLVKQRELVRSGIEGDVRKRLATQHIVLEDMSITSFSFSQAYEAAIESKQVAEQNAEKSKNLLTQAQIEAQTAAARAKGEADAAIQTATGKAQSIVLEATAKAKAQQLQRESLTPELLELRKIEMYNSKWDGALPQYIMGNGGSGLLMQMPTPSTKSAKKSADREDSGNN